MRSAERGKVNVLEMKLGMRCVGELVWKRSS